VAHENDPAIARAKATVEFVLCLSDEMTAQLPEGGPDLATKEVKARQALDEMERRDVGVYPDDWLVEPNFGKKPRLLASLEEGVK
jgi:hypothetical protein